MEISIFDALDTFEYRNPGVLERLCARSTQAGDKASRIMAELVTAIIDQKVSPVEWNEWFESYQKSRNLGVLVEIEADEIDEDEELPEDTTTHTVERWRVINVHPQSRYEYRPEVVEQYPMPASEAAELLNICLASVQRNISCKRLEGVRTSKSDFWTNAAAVEKYSKDPQYLSAQKAKETRRRTRGKGVINPKPDGPRAGTTIVRKNVCRLDVAARSVGITVKAVRHLIRDGHLESYKSGSHILVSTEELREAIRKGRNS